MKKLFILSIFALFASAFVHAQDVTTVQDTNNGPKIQFVSLVHDYGTIEQKGYRKLLVAPTASASSPSPIPATSRLSSRMCAPAAAAPRLLGRRNP